MQQELEGFKNDTTKTHSDEVSPLSFNRADWVLQIKQAHEKFRLTRASEQHKAGAKSHLLDTLSVGELWLNISTQALISSFMWQTEMNGALLRWYSLFLWPSDQRYLRLEIGWCWLKFESCCDLIPPAIPAQDLSQTFTPVIRVLLLSTFQLWFAAARSSGAAEHSFGVSPLYIFVFSFFLEGKLSGFAGSCSPQCSYGSVTVEESTPPDYIQPVVACVNVSLLCRWTASALVMILPNVQSLFETRTQPPASYFMLLHTAVSLTAACLAVCTVLKTFGTPWWPLHSL